MPSMTLEYHSEKERLLLEQAIAYVTQLHQVALSAPDGTVLNACEKVAVDAGRELLRSTLAGALESRVEQIEQKGGPLANARRRTPAVTRAAMKKPS